jgi:MFS family permease
VAAGAAWSPSRRGCRPSTGAALIGFTFCGLGMGLQSASTSLAVMQLSPGAEIGRNTSSLQVGETAGNALLVGAAGTVFAALAPIAAHRHVRHADDGWR